MKLKGNAVLLLQDGSIFEGRAFGARTTAMGECIFHTGHTGYQEILSDPSYHRQFLVFTDPHIGNEGMNPDDYESRKLWAAGAIVRELRESSHHWRLKQSLSAALEKEGIPGISGVDTRRLVLHLRNVGAQWAVLSTDGQPLKQLQKKLAQEFSMSGLSLSAEVSTPSAYEWAASLDPLISTSLAVATSVDSVASTGSWADVSASDVASTLDAAAAAGLAHCVVLDFGVKHQILRYLKAAGFSKITVLPSKTSAQAICSLKPDALFLSNGPGDPAAETVAIATVKELLGKLPILGICLGHQILALALGLKTFKLKFGHHGANHPVKNNRSGLVEITSQNHGFAVAQDDWPEALELTHINLNDHTVEGFRHRQWPVRALQFHPEAAPGPLDSVEIFKEFQKGFS